MDRLLEDVARMKRVTQSLMDPGDKAAAITTTDAGVASRRCLDH
jgi:hypothetical protein